MPKSARDVNFVGQAPRKVGLHLDVRTSRARSIGVGARRGGPAVNGRCAPGARLGGRVLGAPPGPSCGHRGAARGSERADRDAHGLGQVAVLPGAGAGDGRAHGGGLAAGRADAGPGGGAQARRRGHRRHPFGTCVGGQRGRLAPRGGGRHAAALHGAGAADDRAGAVGGAPDRRALRRSAPHRHGPAPAAQRGGARASQRRGRGEARRRRHGRDMPTPLHLGRDRHRRETGYDSLRLCGQF